MIQSNEAVFFSRGDAPTYTVSPISGDRLLLDFDYAMLKEEEYSPGVELLGSYSFSPIEDYPVPLTVLAAEHLYLSEPDKIILAVKGMTSIEYGSVLTPAVAFDYRGQGLPNEFSDFTGIEIGTGTSFASSSLLSLSKDVGDIYGWEFVDSSGRLSPIDSTYRMDVSFNAGNAAVMPVMGENSTLAHFVFADGNTKLSISLDKLSGQDVLSVSGYADLPAAWSSGVHTLSVILSLIHI